MRIALLASTTAYWTPLYARHFLARGHETRIFSLTPEPLAGFDVVHVTRGRGAIIPRPLWFLAHVPRVRRLLREYQPDVVLATYMSSNGVTAALAWNGPLVVSGHGGDLLTQHGYLPGGVLLHQPMISFECRRAHAVHVVAPELVERLVDYGVPEERIECFPVGVDSQWFAPSTAPKPGSPIRIVCTRRQEPVYANHVLVNALGRLRDRGIGFRCTLVGGGPLLDERRAQIAALGLNDRVECVGQVPLDRVRAALDAGHVYVSASTSDGTSSSLLEAMLCGLLPVVSRIRANESWVRDGETGLLFDIGDDEGLARALERAVVNPAFRDAAASRNRELVESRGDLRRNMDRMVDLLARVASGRHARAEALGRLRPSFDEPA